ncbi:unnamed protein product, partial [Owenia fusiformis]
LPTVTYILRTVLHIKVWGKMLCEVPISLDHIHLFHMPKHGWVGRENMSITNYCELINIYKHSQHLHQQVQSPFHESTNYSILIVLGFHIDVTVDSTLPTVTYILRTVLHIKVWGKMSVAYAYTRYIMHHDTICHHFWW